MRKTAYKVTFPTGDIKIFPFYPATYERYSSATITCVFWPRKQKQAGRAYAGP